MSAGLRQCVENAFERCRLLSLIGEGGIGKVSKGHNTVIDRGVAIKALPTEPDRPPTGSGFTARPKTATQLAEPHIIPITHPNPT